MQQIRGILFFLFIISALYCYGAGMMDYFAVYEPWKLIDAKDFAAYHQFQGKRIIWIFVIPSAIMTIFNLASAIWPPRYLRRKWLWLALLAYMFDWIFSFTMQIPIQFELERRKDLSLLSELLRTNWWRFAADTVHCCIVLFMIWTSLEKMRKSSLRHHSVIINP
ncbi:MAG: hypothetical protein EOO01_19425 [Chitinophagaceae bacterium]|nr:MAG: hypothetical protein EOO01_19425 [Chitinophagaceae bacterium]